MRSLFRMANNRESRDTTARSAPSVQSVDRAISILQVLAKHGSARVTEIADDLDLHKSTVSRLLGTLEARGLVAQNGTRGRYTLGDGVLAMAAGATKRHGTPTIDRQVCQDLAQAVGETIVVTILDGDAVLSIEQIIGPAAVTSVNWIGRRSPLHATSSGKLFLAHLPPESLRERLPEPLERYTEYTITDHRELAEDLARIREIGYSTVHEELEMGLSALSAPVRDLQGRLIAALTVSAPSFRLLPEAVPDVAQIAGVAAARLSELNGYPKKG